MVFLSDRKISDGWTVGTPVVSTSIGEEGMTSDGKPWGGLVGDTTAEIVENAVELFTNENLWNQAQEAGANLVNELFNKEKNGQAFMNKMEEIVDNLPAIRRQNITGEALRYHSKFDLVNRARWYTQRLNKTKDEEKNLVE